MYDCVCCSCASPDSKQIETVKGTAKASEKMPNSVRKSACSKMDVKRKNCSKCNPQNFYSDNWRPMNEKTITGWSVREQNELDHVLTIDNIDIRTPIDFSNCWISDFRVTTKCNSVKIYNCYNCKFEFNSVITSISIIDSKDCSFQTKGTLPAVTIDGSSGISIFVDDASMGCQITTSKSSDLMFNYKKTVDADEYTELVIPHQFQHELEKDKIVSRVSDLYYY